LDFKGYAPKVIACQCLSASVFNFWDGQYVAMFKTIRDTATKNYQLKKFSQENRDREW